MNCATTSGMKPMRRPLFLPTARQTNWLLVVGFLALGQALYLRYMALENNTVSLACQAGLRTWLCDTFRLTILLVNHNVFRWLALAAAAFGIVLHNADLAGLALGLLILSLARPAPAAE